MNDTSITVEVAYARPDRQEIIALTVAVGSTAFDAALASGIRASFPEINLEETAMGIFGKALKAPRAYVLRAGDRVEIYRPLKIDPKQARLDRARRKSG